MSAGSAGRISVNRVATRASIDFETRSIVDLRKTGVYPYAKHKFTDLWCFSWAFDDDEPAIWRRNDPFPDELRKAIVGGIELRAWNAAFERIIWKHIGVPRWGFPNANMEQWVCTAAEAAAMALPRGLDQAATVLGVRHKKDRDGYALMMRMTRPRRWVPEEMDEPVWWEVPDRLERLYAYCMQDLRAERDVFKVLHRLTPGERQAYLLTEKINDRGVPLDRALVKAAIEIVREGTERAELVLDEITGGRVTAVTQNARLTAWLNAEGVATKSIAKAAVAELMESDLSPDVAKVLQLRFEVGRSSNAKLQLMLDVADSHDDRARGLELYHGARTGRWAGKLIQPHNFPKGDVPDVEQYIPDVVAGAYDTIDLYENPVAVVSSMLRAMIKAPDGYVLLGADFSAIEARVLNWIAGQADIVALFASGEDVYVHNAMRMYGLQQHEVKKFPHRHTGKFAELAMGYQMGAKTAQRQGKQQYEIDLTLEQAQELVDDYRGSHPEVVQLWKDSNNAVKRAVKSPGEVVKFGPMKNLALVRRGSYLYLILPSKRALVYAAPNMENVIPPWGEEQMALDVAEFGVENVDPESYKMGAVTVWGVDSLTKKWVKYALYGGLIVENIVQALARDIMLGRMLALEVLGYENILNVHDEILLLAPDDFGSVEEVEQTMRQVPAWATGCPISAEGWRGERYRK